MLLCTHSVD